jgi:hypothetical protein
MMPVIVLLAWWSPAAWGQTGTEGNGVARASALRTIEGEVVGVTESPAEGGSTVLAAEVAAGENSYRLVLAPERALAAIEFEIEIGDSVRARVFGPDENGDSRVQKIINLTRGGVARLRGVRCGPLWNDSGGWHGSPGRHDHSGQGGSGRQHRGGR